MFDHLLRMIGKAALEVAEEALRNAATNPTTTVKAKRRAGMRPPPEPRQPPETLNETVTAVLRRQVPPRNVAPRSWIGGLPMMPDFIAWPRARNGENPGMGALPLNFLAQIACADLPADLWGGLGPRHGWLIFFCASWGCASFEDANSFRVYHILELGDEQQPPDDKVSVGNPGYSGGDNPALIYARWPVDIIAIRNAPDYPSGVSWHGDALVSPIPPDFAATLYDGAPVGTGMWHPTEKPFTWGTIVAMLERALQKWGTEPTRRIRADRMPADARDRALAAIDDEEARLASSMRFPDLERETRRVAYVARMRADLAESRAVLARVGDPFDPEALARIMESSQADHEIWRAQQVDLMIDLLAEASAHPSTAPLLAEDHARFDALFRVEHVTWYLDTSFSDAKVSCPRPTRWSLGMMLSNARQRAVASGAREVYRAGAQERASLPDDLRAALEADLRRLEYNRPHRLGGIHQSVQESRAPPGKALLLQLGDDDPTGFQWGDSGALFAWVDIDALRQCDFRNVKWWTENM